MIRFAPALAAAIALTVGACTSSRTVVVDPAPAVVAVAPPTGPSRRIAREGASYVLPDGTRVAANDRGGFTLPNGEVVIRERSGALILPNGSRCLPDAGGFACP